MNTRNKVVNEISKINFQGNIIPKNWYKVLVNEKGKPNLKAITLLSEIVYWYRASEKRSENTSTVKYAVKFHADKLQLSYSKIEAEFGFTKEESRAAFEFLESFGLVTREYRTITIDGGVLNNRMYLEPNPDRIKEVTFPLPLSENSNEGHEEIPTTLIGKFPLPLSENSNDNTKITTKTTTQTTTIKNNPISTSTLLEIKSKLKKINENLKLPYLESNKANQLYDTAAKNFEGNFDELFQDTIKKLLDLSTKGLDKFSPIRKGVSIQSLTAFNCELIGAIAIEHAKVFPKSQKVDVKKEVLPEKDQHEKEIVEFVKYFSGKVPSFPIDKLAKHLQSDTRVQEIYRSLKEAS